MSSKSRKSRRASGDQEDNLYFGIYVAHDDSHVTVQSNNVVYEEPVRVGDRVKFYYPPGSKTLDEGDIRAIENDYHAVNDVMDQLNDETKPKRERSFHEGEPRSAKLKCLRQGFGGPSGRKEQVKRAPTQAHATVGEKSNPSATAVRSSCRAKSSKSDSSSSGKVIQSRTLSLHSSDSDDNNGTEGNCRNKQVKRAPTQAHATAVKKSNPSATAVRSSCRAISSKSEPSCSGKVIQSRNLSVPFSNSDDSNGTRSKPSGFVGDTGRKEQVKRAPTQAHATAGKKSNPSATSVGSSCRSKPSESEPSCSGKVIQSRNLSVPSSDSDDNNGTEGNCRNKQVKRAPTQAHATAVKKSNSSATAVRSSCRSKPSESEPSCSGKVIQSGNLSVPFSNSDDSNGTRSKPSGFVGDTGRKEQVKRAPTQAHPTAGKKSNSSATAVGSSGRSKPSESEPSCSGKVIQSRNLSVPSSDSDDSNGTKSKPSGFVGDTGRKEQVKRAPTQVHATAGKKSNPSATSVGSSCRSKPSESEPSCSGKAVQSRSLILPSSESDDNNGNDGNCYGFLGNADWESGFNADDYNDCTYDNDLNEVDDGKKTEYPCSSDSSDVDLSAAEVQLLEKLSKKHKQADFQRLLALTKKKSSHSLDMSGPDFMPGNITREDEWENSSVKKSGESNGDYSSLSKNTPKEKKSRCCKGVTNPKLEFVGNYYRHTASDPKVVRLLQRDCEIYILEKDMKGIKLRRSQTSIVRQLLRCVFSDEALSQCSVSGKPSHMKGRENFIVRPPLAGEGVHAILEFVARRSAKKSWPIATPSYLKMAMNNALAEFRDAAKSKPRM